MMYSESAQPSGNVQFEEEQQPTHLSEAIRGNQRQLEAVIRAGTVQFKEKQQLTHLSPPAESVVRLKSGAGQ